MYLKRRVWEGGGDGGRIHTLQYFVAMPRVSPDDLPWSHHSPEMAQEAPCQDFVSERWPQNMAKSGCFQCLQRDAKSVAWVDYGEGLV